MKNYKVVATRKFRDSNEIDPMTYLKKERQQGDEFLCTKERYEFLKSNGAVTLVEIVDEVTEEVVQAVANAIVEEAIEQDKPIEKVVKEIVVESKEEKPKKKNKKKVNK